MRSLLLFTLATSIACEVTDETTNSDSGDAMGNDSAQQTVEEPTEFKASDELAGGIDHHPDGLIWADDVDHHPDPQESLWNAAPMQSGLYEGTVVKILLNECKFIAPGEEIEARLRMTHDGQTLLNGGLLQARGEDLRFRRVADAPINGTEDCYQVEYTTGQGTMVSETEMTMDFEIDVELEGTDCPVLDPCQDVYTAHFSHTSNSVDNPFDTDDLPELEPDLGDEIF